jgi:hypothetical protein
MARMLPRMWKCHRVRHAASARQCAGFENHPDGRGVTTFWRLVVSELTELTTGGKSQVLCKNCGAKNPEFALFCFSCGAQQTQGQALANASVTSDPTYSGFVMRLLLGLFLLAAAAFDTCQWATQQGAASKFLRPTVVSLIAIAFLLAARKSWGTSIGPSLRNGTRAPDKRRIVTVSLMIGSVLLCIAILFGWLIGRNRQQLRVLDVDLAQYAAIGDRISKARSNAVDSIPDWVRMYESIEPDVIALQSCSSRLVGELRDYDNDFPEFHAQTAKSIATVSATQRRMVLVMKQIDVAKKVKAVDSSEQRTVWVDELLPLAKEEDKLDEAK